VAWDVACDNLGKDVSAVVGHGQAECSALLINLGLAFNGRVQGAKESQTWTASVSKRSNNCSGDLNNLNVVVVSFMLLVAFRLQPSSQPRVSVCNVL
jgi:hypothetical protein